jgi:hypothetical protein
MAHGVMRGGPEAPRAKDCSVPMLVKTRAALESSRFPSKPVAERPNWTIPQPQHTAAARQSKKAAMNRECVIPIETGLTECSDEAPVQHILIKDHSATRRSRPAGGHGGDVLVKHRPRPMN